jgi:putative membrane protein
MKARDGLKRLALVAALCAGGAAFAQSGSTGTGSSVTGGQSAPAVQAGAGTQQSDTRKGEKLSRGDRKFLEKAAGSGMFEVQVSQLAASKASDAQVKSYANMLVDHHTAANNELVQIANARGVELPAGPPHHLRREVEKIGKHNGADFDRTYVREVGIQAHEKDIKLFQKARKDVKDAQLKAWVDKTLPVLQQHLADAKKLPESGNKDAMANAMGNAAAGPAASSIGTGSNNPKAKGS